MDLLADIPNFLEYLRDEENNPDARFRKVVEETKYKNYLCTKDHQQICDACGIAFSPPPNKQDVADFLNYLSTFTGDKVFIQASDIGDSQDVAEAIFQGKEEVIVANLNLNLATEGEMILERKELIKRAPSIQAVLISLLEDTILHKDVFETFTGRKPEAGIVGFTMTGEKLMFVCDKNLLSDLFQNELKGKTLITKWGLFRPGLRGLIGIMKTPAPNVVLYNLTSQMNDSFHDWFSKGNIADYLFVGAMEDHPFNTLILKDAGGILHLVNGYGTKHIGDFLKTNRKFLCKKTPETFNIDPTHYNNVFSVWMGLRWDIDWYRTMIDGKNVIWRTPSSASNKS